METSSPGPSGRTTPPWNEGLVSTSHGLYHCGKDGGLKTMGTKFPTIVMTTALVLGTMFVLVMSASTPTVEYDSATRKPVTCFVEPDDNGVNVLDPSDPRCQKIIKGRHNAVWVAPRTRRGR